MMPFAATWVELEIIMDLEIIKASQTEKDKYEITYTQNLKKGYKRISLQSRNRVADVEKLMVTREWERGTGA